MSGARVIPRGNGIDAEELLKALNRTLQNRTVYPAGHPAIMAPLREVWRPLTAALEAAETLNMALVDDVMLVNGRRVYRPRDRFPELVGRLGLHGVQQVIFHRGVEENEMGLLVAALREPPVPGKPPVAAQLGELGVCHVEVTALTPKAGEQRSSRQVYADALQVVMDAFREVRLGRIPQTERTRRVVLEMTEYLLRDPAGMIGLALLQNYDETTFNHSVSVCILSLALGDALKLRGVQLAELGIGALLHDLGKTRVPVEILRKPDVLTPREFEEIKKHPGAGAEIVARMDQITQDSVLAVLEHHMKFDRTGYPRLPEVEELSLQGRIVAIADCYAAVTSLRAYRPPLQPPEAVGLIRSLAGTDLDPDLVKIFVDLMGIHPVGSFVRLDTNELAIVSRVNPEQPLLPTVKVVFTAEGDRLPAARELDLRTAGVRVVAGLNPVLKAVDVAAYLG